MSEANSNLVNLSDFRKKVKQPLEGSIADRLARIEHCQRRLMELRIMIAKERAEADKI